MLYLSFAWTGTAIANVSTKWCCCTRVIMATAMSAADVEAISKVLYRIRRDNRLLIRVSPAETFHHAA